MNGFSFAQAQNIVDVADMAVDKIQAKRPDLDKKQLLRTTHRLGAHAAVSVVELLRYWAHLAENGLPLSFEVAPSGGQSLSCAEQSGDGLVDSEKDKAAQEVCVANGLCAAVQEAAPAVGLTYAMDSAELRLAIASTLGELRPPVMGAGHPQEVKEALVAHLQALLQVEKQRAAMAVHDGDAWPKGRHQ